MSRYCLKCGKAKAACICDWIKSIATQVELVILQHRTESKHPMGTAKILQLSLPTCQCFIGEDFSQHQQLNQKLDDKQYMSLVLYPSVHSHILSSEFLTGVNPQGKKIQLILIDATWKKAYKIWQLSTNLHQFPQIALPQDLVGHYRIRKAPTKQHLSTVEAGFHALRLIEPTNDFYPLVNAFNHMIDYQISQMSDGIFERNYVNNTTLN